MLSLGIVLCLAQQKPFEPTWESLKNYSAPAWFRDAKFGIWAHWGPQSVPMAGDWYARNMYLQGQGQYEHHLKTYGHPSEHGFREIIEMWKAEKWDPDSLMKLYKASGAKYFVSMGVHHDNFDLWNSKFHSWNATQHGPHRDVVGEWQKAAKKQGLPFGVSEHLGASYTWWAGSKGSDKTGTKAGIPYDGTNKAYQELYHPLPAPDDRGWYSTNPAWHKEWSDRIGDLVTHYKPDLLYSDGGVPFGGIGRAMMAKLYNQNRNTVYLAKDIGSGEMDPRSLVLDRERGGMADIQPLPWQTDTSIGDWFYNKNWGYRKPDWVVHTLVDTVSKNGNLLLNVVQRPDGSLDPQVYDLLHEVGAWLKVNGEAIYGTRPWKTFGEGPTKVAGGHFREDFPWTARDIRYTRKGKNTLYATLMGNPSVTSLNLRSLALLPGVCVSIKQIQLLGSKEKIAFTHGPEGLLVTLPKSIPGDYAHTLKITVSDVEAFKPELLPPLPVETIKAGADGKFTLPVDVAELNGGVQTEVKNGQENIGMWSNASDTVTWNLNVPKTGTYRITTEIASLEDSSVDFKSGTESVTLPVKATGAFDIFRPIAPIVLKLSMGTQKITLKPTSSASWKAINVRKVILTPIE